MSTWCSDCGRFNWLTDRCKLPGKRVNRDSLSCGDFQHTNGVPFQAPSLPKTNNTWGEDEDATQSDIHRRTGFR